MHRLALVSFLMVLIAGSWSWSAAQNPLAQAEEELLRATELQEGGEYESALEHAERAYELAAAVLDAEDPGLGRFLDRRGSIHRNLGHPSEARADFERALALRETALEPDDPELADSLYSLAVVHLDAGEFEAARDLFARALEIREAVLEPDDGDVANTWNALAVAERFLGRDEAALRGFARARDIFVRTLGPDHPRVAGPLVNMAVLQHMHEDYDAARRNFERAIEIYEAGLGPDHPRLGVPWLELGTVYYILGDNPAARQAYEKALGLFEAAYGPDHPRVAGVLENMGELARDEGRYDEAVELLERARAIQVETQGPRHHRVAHVLHYLGDVARDRGRPEEALAHYAAALDIREEALGPDDRLVAATLMGMGRSQLELGRVSQARESFERALRIRTEVFGPDARWTGGSLHALAELDAKQGDASHALERSLRAAAIARLQLRSDLRSLAERPGLLYTIDRGGGVGRDLAVSLATRQSDRDVTLRVWTELARSRSMVFDEVAERLRVAAESDDPVLQSLRTELAAAADSLARASRESPDSVAVWASRKEGVERELAQRSRVFREQRGRDDFDLSAALRSLPPSTVVVAFVRHRDLLAEEDRYAAFVARDAGAQVRALDCGSAGEIDALVDRWREECRRGDRLPGRSAAEALDAARRAGRELRERVLDPVFEDGVPDHVVLVPDATLQLVSFGTLPFGNEWLVESGLDLEIVDTERELPLEDSPGSRTDTLLAVGDPDFDHADANDAATASFRGPESDCGALRDRRFESLRYAREEVETIGTMGRETLALLGAEATEERVKSLAPGRTILHFATHGFFVDEACEVLPAENRGVGGMVAASEGVDRATLPGSPLSGCGLVLAGAHLRGERPEGAQDGWLTGEEIANLDLRSVRWAVLSACDTGVGRAAASEGVLGLRRAFALAGAGTCVLSLWSIDDAATRELMVELHRERLRSGASASRCLAAAQRTVLTRWRAEGRSVHPSRWGAFVAVGRD